MTEMFDNRYEIKERLGSGGMADVYLARDTHLDRDVAIKILYKRYASDEEFVARFRQEAQSAAGLNHPHIVSIYDRGEAEGSYYIAMEYLQGKSLKELIAARGMFPVDKAILVTEQILEALQFAHEHDVVHRDIKPANIIVNGRGQVKVTDFGIARAGSSARMTETGSIIGTAQYLSPEQAKGTSVGQSTDLYSAGVVLYEMLTGRVPFEGENPVAIALKHISDIPVPPQALVPELPDNINNVVMKSLAKDPAERYASAAEFLEDLERCRQNLAVAPVAEEEATRVIPAAGVAAAGAAAAAAATPDEAMAASGAVTGEAAAAAPKKKSSAGRKFLYALLIIAALAAIGAGIYFLTTQGQAVAVPDVVGMTQADAEDVLREAGFEVELDAEEYSETVPEGSVVRQDPDAGEMLREGGTVRLVVSRGSGLVAVPDLLGQTTSYAEAKLAEFELRGDRQPDAFSDSVPSGSIISQDPPAGTEVQRGSTVRYVVSKGAEPVQEATVPNLDGMTQSEAENALSAEGLVLGSVSEDYSDDVPAGRVMSQSPAAGQSIPEGSAVDITLSLGPEPNPISVPNVLGDTVDVAVPAIEAEGLVANPIPAAPDPTWVVSAQDPAAFSMVPEGTVVTLTFAAP